MEMSIQDLITLKLNQADEPEWRRASELDQRQHCSVLDELKCARSTRALLGLKKRTLSLDSTSYDAKTISNDRILNVLCGMS